MWNNVVGGGSEHTAKFSELQSKNFIGREDVKAYRDIAVGEAFCDKDRSKQS